MLCFRTVMMEMRRQLAGSTTLRRAKSRDPLTRLDVDRWPHDDDDSLHDPAATIAWAHVLSLSFALTVSGST